MVRLTEEAIAGMVECQNNGHTINHHYKVKGNGRSRCVNIMCLTCKRVFYKGKNGRIPLLLAGLKIRRIKNV